jgi:hypothetical protein
MRGNQVSKTKSNANMELPRPVLANSAPVLMSERAYVMPDKISSGTILIREGTALPAALPFESEPCSSGWRLVKDLDGGGLDRKIHEAGWTFFCMAGEIKTIVFGFEGHKRVRRAVKRILASLKMEGFNSLEITRVAPKHFLGVPYVSISTRSRHIQESMFLFRAKDLQELGPRRIECRPNQSIGLATGKGLPEETLRQPGVANDLEAVIV